jgi:hypothetical protein
LHPGSDVRFKTIVFLISILAGACTTSPGAPSEGGASGLLQGQTVNAIDGGAAAGLVVTVGRAQPVTSDREGHFVAVVGGHGTYHTTIQGDQIVERQTKISGPASSPQRLSVIPSTFNLQAFDEMCRSANNQLQRWTTAPALVVLASVMSYRGGTGDEYGATSEQLSDDEVTEMVAHLTEGLALLTGGTYGTFASVQVERPSSGDRVTVTRNGKIVVGRYNGIVSLASTIGYGQWLAGPDGAVSGGAIFLDRDFDRDDRRRRLLRIHELGHALGYLHVTSAPSIMNPSIGPEPTAFDRGAAIIAFQRPPGNRSPDVDPLVLAERGWLSPATLRWADPIP